MKKLNEWVEKKPSIHEYETDSMVVSVHHHISCGNRWYLSVGRLGIRTKDLDTYNLKEAKSKAIGFVSSYLKSLLHDLTKEQTNAG